MWQKMWQESQLGRNHGSRAGTPHQQNSPLADPPAVKELVRAEVKMLLQTLRERISKGARDGEELLFRYKPEIVNYALCHLDSCYSNCTNLGEIDNGSRPSSHCSVQSSAEDEIEAVRDKLNVTDIDQVVDRLRSVLMEECEVLKRLVKHLKSNIKERCRSQCEFVKSEPTLAELKELRGAIQMDLELYPSSFDASPQASSLLLKELKSGFRLSAGQKDSDETLQALNATSVLKPHPPLPPFGSLKPRPPVGHPLTKTIRSSSLSRTHGQHRSTSASNKSSKTPICSNITTSGRVNSQFTTDQIMVQSEYHCSPEQDRAGLHCRTLTSGPSFRKKTQRNSPVHEAHLSSHRSIHSLSREYDLSPQRERKNSSTWRSRNSNFTPSPIPALSPLSDAGTYSNSSTDHSGSTIGKSETQNGQRISTYGSGLESATVETDNNRRKSTPESFNSSVLSETGRPVKKGGSRIDRKENGHLEKDVTQQQSFTGHCFTDNSSHHSESSGEQGQSKCIQPASIQLNGQFFTSRRRPLGGTTSQSKSVHEAQTEPQFVNKFYQPVPPTRVST
ncbi:coiled-coil domain-containing protein 24 isoform X2 [Toxotes jaculatrix]|nr:coiled-coil domain-containing protein 24 isoform X2 [Toxotes jaculatrix]